MNRLRPKIPPGFTLVEVLVGLTLLGFVLVMIFSALYSTSRSWTAGDRQAQANDDFRLILSFVRREFNETVPIFYRNGNSNHVIFRGDRKSVDFVSRLPAHRGGAGLYLVSLGVDRDDKGKGALIFHYQPLNPDITLYQKGEGSKSQLLIKDVSAINLAYYGREKPDDEPAWHDNWQDKDRLPTLIRLGITAADSGVNWPDLFMAIPVQAVRGEPEMVMVPSRKGS